MLKSEIMTPLQIEKIQQDGAYQALARAISDKLWDLRKASEDATQENFKHFDTHMQKMRELLADVQSMHSYLLITRDTSPPATS
jgi:hypothetical protein